MEVSKFKPYVQDQPLLLPPSLDELIAKNDLVRVVNATLDGLEWKSLLAKVDLEGGGVPPYDPRMMLKVLVYAYSQRLYSCRDIAKALRQNVHFMWLSGMQRPTFNSVNRFRSDYLREVLEPVFAQVMELLLASGHVKAQTYFVDGTKIESAANRHQVIYSKNMEKWRRAREILAEVEAINAAEDRQYGPADLAELGERAKALSASEIAASAERINQELQANPPASKRVAGKVATRVRKLNLEAAQVAKYEQAQAQLEGRNSGAVSDPQAVVMPMKQSGEFRPGYNLQASTDSGFVTGFSLGSNPNDASALPGHLERQKTLGLPQPQTLVADAGYGHEEVYEQLQQAGIEAVIKPKDYALSQRTRGRAAYHKGKFSYDEARDCYTCPQGRVLEARQCTERQRVSGYVARITEYRSLSCAGCPARSLCLRGEAHRTLSINHKLEAHQARMQQKLATEEGRALYRRRSHGIETLFGDMKANRAYRRFRLRGLAKNTLDLAIYFTAHNLRKLFTLTPACPI